MSTQVDFGQEYLDVIKRDGIECRSQEMIHDLWPVKSQKRGRSFRSPKKHIEVKCQFWLSISKRIGLKTFFALSKTDSLKVVAYIYNLLSFRQFMLHAPVLEILKYTFSDHVHPSSGHGFSLR